MNIVYFASPMRINPPKATALKNEFLCEASWILMEHDIHVESPHIKYLFTQTHPDYTRASDEGRPNLSKYFGLAQGENSDAEDHNIQPDLDKYARDQGIHLIEDYPIDAVVALTSPEELSDGMQAEVDTAEEREIPVYYFPYFTTENDRLRKNGANIENLRDILAEI